jgi:hypothetical protein
MIPASFVLPSRPAVEPSPTVVTRTALYEQVWTTPMMKLATEYRITGTGLAKVCRKANIPVPPARVLEQASIRQAGDQTPAAAGDSERHRRDDLDPAEQSGCWC